MVQLAEHGRCYLENPKVSDYQCLCKSKDFQYYRYIVLALSILTLLFATYINVDLYRIIQKRKNLKKLFKLRILALGIVWVGTVTIIVYFIIDPHSCARELSFVAESILYGYGIMFPAILLMIIILRWIDLLKVSFATQKHVLFHSKTKKIFFSVMVFWFCFETVCRIFWQGSISYIYFGWGFTYTFVCFFSFLVVGTKLNRRLLYGAKASGMIDSTRRKQINEIYKVSFAGSLITVLVLVEIAVVSLFGCLNKETCALSVEFLWKIEQLIIYWLYLMLVYRGNKAIKNPNITKKIKNQSKIDLVENRSEKETGSSNNNSQTQNQTNSSNNKGKLDTHSSENSDSSDTTSLSNSHISSKSSDVSQI
ncbi:zinc finger cchc domain-containing protein [Anaeramoeba flamelloides]|uniref:Zinc finger cchc domain-containing protein n=1 Tax=Anaeramoeba flamelloides TaxID=1746091 RepID=A0ABQ8YNI2_9EUKA|nr:zinc finger cchc domain-containing protein [Anaeramoeba flamelloides]